MKEGMLNKIFLGIITLVGIIIAFMISNEDVYKKSGSYAGINFAYLITLVLLIVGIAAILFFVVKSIMNNPGKIKIPIISVIAMIVVFFVAKMMDGGEILSTYTDFGVETAGQSKTVGGFLGLMWTLLALSLFSIVGYFFMKLFKNNG